MTSRSRLTLDDVKRVADELLDPEGDWPCRRRQTPKGRRTARGQYD